MSTLIQSFTALSSGAIKAAAVQLYSFYKQTKSTYYVYRASVMDESHNTLYKSFDSIYIEPKGTVSCAVC
jgi:hypothetical protein